MAKLMFLLVVAGTALLSVRLYTEGLSGTYRAFFRYLIFAAVTTGFMMNLGSDGAAYLYSYLLTEPISWIFHILVVLELFSLVLADYQGLATVGRWAMIGAVVLAVLASALSFLAPSHDPVHVSRVLPIYYRVERAVYISLVVFLVTILLVLLQYPIKLKRNIAVHSVIFSIYFLCNTVVFSLLSLRGFVAVPVVKYAVLTVSVGSLGVWLMLLNKAGEVLEVRLRPAWMPGREDELVDQLKTLNESLLRTRK